MNYPSRIITIAAQVLVCIFVSSFLSSKALGDSNIIPIIQKQCFQANYLLMLPQVQGLQYLKEVDSLAETDPTDLVTIREKEASALADGQTLRLNEQKSFVQLNILLKQMSGPTVLQAWTNTDISRLKAPLALTKDEKKDSKSDASAATMMALIDEIDILRKDIQAHVPELRSWINLTQGKSGLWAADVGSLTADLHEAATTNTQPTFAASAARALLKGEPLGEPSNVTMALKSLQPKGGNLAALIPAYEDKISLATAKKASDTLIACFS